MKHYFGVLLLISFIALAVFGAFAMHAGMQNHNSGCIAAQAKGVDCPKQGNFLSYLNFHLDAIKDFSNTILSGNVLISFLTLVLLVGAAIGLGILAPPQLNFKYSYLRDRNPRLSKREFIRWLALHENSPTSI